MDAPTGRIISSHLADGERYYTVVCGRCGDEVACAGYKEPKCACGYSWYVDAVAVANPADEECEHANLNDNGDFCLDCKSTYIDGKWQ